MKLEKNTSSEFFITLVDVYWLSCLLCIASYLLLHFPAGDYSVTNQKREHHIYCQHGSYVIVTILFKKIQWFIQNHGMGYPDLKVAQKRLLSLSGFWDKIRFICDYTAKGMFSELFLRIAGWLLQQFSE